MISAALPRPRVAVVVLLICGIAWLLLLSRSDALADQLHRFGDPVGGLEAHPRPALGPLPPLMTDWALMLVAMMSPLLIAPVRHVLERSFRRRRARLACLFVVGHGLVWMAAGVMLLGAALGLRHFAAETLLPVAGVAVAAAAWQCSPTRQRCVNRSHHHPPLAAFGAAADLDALRFGVTHGAWCVGSCWALMLLPLALPRGHLMAMIVITLVLVSERLEGPRPPRWRLRVPLKLLRLVMAQTRMRFRARPPASRGEASRADP